MKIRKNTLESPYIRQGSFPGLERMRALMKLLEDPQDRIKTVQIAGTNGKGSTAAMIASLLKEAGYKTGLYTSPGVFSFNERICLNGEPINADEFERTASKVEKAAAKLPELGYEYPSEFEFVTAAAFLWFYESGCSAAVIEAGMGGRLDATNIIRSPEVSVICAIGLDHTKELGGSIPMIAFEKAGIIKGGRAVSYGHLREADDVIASRCEETGARLRIPDFDALKPLDYSVCGQRFLYKDMELFIPFCGKYQLNNAAVAVETACALRESGFDITDGAIRLGLEKTVWRARFEMISRAPLIVLDGSHNPHGVSALAETLSKTAPKWIFVFGVLADKDYTEMLSLVAPLTYKMYTASPDSRRALPSVRLKEMAEEMGIAAFDGESVDGAVRAALVEQLASRLPVCIFGSLYMAAEASEAVCKYIKTVSTKTDVRTCAESCANIFDKSEESGGNNL